MLFPERFNFNNNLFDDDISDLVAIDSENLN